MRDSVSLTRNALQILADEWNSVFAYSLNSPRSMKVRVRSCGLCLVSYDTIYTQQQAREEIDAYLNMMLPPISEVEEYQFEDIVKKIKTVVSDEEYNFFVNSFKVTPIG